jgi:DNA mismatch repair ATPase MutS
MEQQPDNTSDIEQSIARYNSLTTFLTVLATIIGIVCAISTIEVSRLFLLGFIPVVILTIIVSVISAKRNKLKLILQIKGDWGKTQVTKERDYKTIRLLFDTLSAQRKGANSIDDTTWNDLNMDQLYARIDRTYTDPGQAVLYRILREPLFDKEALAYRDRVIAFFQKNKESREKIRLALVSLKRQFVHIDLYTLLGRDSFPKSSVKLFYYFMAAAAVVSILVPFIFWSLILVVFPISVFLINLFIHYSIKRKTDQETVSFPYLIQYIKTAGELSKITDGEIKAFSQKLSELNNACNKIVKNTRFLFPTKSSFTDSGILFEYISIFFLLEVRAFCDTSDELNKHITELRELYLTLGELDALQSVASYRASLAVYSVPVFDGNGSYLEIKEARQPLLEIPVPVSIAIHNNIILITGSNMGGKSTFLRTIGNNVLTAQTIATVSAASYRGAFFRVVSSISRTDDLAAGKSYYYVEAERILKTMQGFSAGISALCIIDELLSGTNSIERLHASEAIIQYLAKQNTLAVIATHDLELAERLNGLCDFYHFASTVDENGLKFDYLLRPGIATTRNAIALLKYLGYPKEITEKAEREG